VTWNTVIKWIYLFLRGERQMSLSDTHVTDRVMDS